MTDTAQQDDIQELIRSIHAERQAAKEKERREGWTRYVSLMVVVLAVATAFGSLKAGGFGSKVMLYQAQASDTWAFYQAKSIKQRIAEMEARRSTGDEAASAAADVERYRTEEKDLQAKAEGLEAARDTPEGRALITAETRTLLRRTQRGADSVRLTLDGRHVTSRHGRGDRERVQRVRFDDPDDARSAYFTRLEELAAKGYLDATQD